MGRAIVVLGGGGVKGIAHVGAWKAIEESDLEVVGIIGTSIGALVGACIAAGWGSRELEPRAASLKKVDIVSLNRWTLLLNGIRQPSVFRGEPLRSFIEATLPVQSYEELRIPLAINAVDLETGRMEWFGQEDRTDVPLVDAVYASCALPIFYPPAEIDGRYYVDDGVGDALAIDRAAGHDVDLVLAVDVSAGPVKDSLDTIGKGLVAIHHRVFDIMSHARRRERLAAWSGPPLLHVRPRLDGYSTFDFGQTAYFLEEGYRAAREALAGWPDAAIPAD